TEHGASLPMALDELAALFHRIAIAQAVPDATDALPDASHVTALASAFAPDAVQLAYQICVQGRADLALAPDEPTGFAMTLLRLLAFEPTTSHETPAAGRLDLTTSIKSSPARAAPESRGTPAQPRIAVQSESTSS